MQTAYSSSQCIICLNDGMLEHESAAEVMSKGSHGQSHLNNDKSVIISRTSERQPQKLN